jgi:hypothetical protein
MSLVLTLLINARCATAAKLIRLWRTQTVAAVFRFSLHSSVTKTEPKSLEPVHTFFILYCLLLPLFLIFIFLFLVLTKANGSISVACISAAVWQNGRTKK